MSVHGLTARICFIIFEDFKHSIDENHRGIFQFFPDCRELNSHVFACTPSCFLVKGINFCLQRYFVLNGMEFKFGTFQISDLISWACLDLGMGKNIQVLIGDFCVVFYYLCIYTVLFLDTTLEPSWCFMHHIAHVFIYKVKKNIYVYFANTRVLIYKVLTVLKYGNYWKCPSLLRFTKYLDCNILSIETWKASIHS